MCRTAYCQKKPKKAVCCHLSIYKLEVNAKQLQTGKVCVEAMPQHAHRSSQQYLAVYRQGNLVQLLHEHYATE